MPAQPPTSHPRSRLANSAARQRPLVSLTPLIDVVFILLLFFMLASDFLDLHAIPLDAPAATGEGSQMRGALLVEVRQDGLRLAGLYVSLEGLTTKVSAQLQTKPERRVLVRPGPGVDLQQLVTVLDALVRAGAVNLSLLGDPAA